MATVSCRLWITLVLLGKGLLFLQVPPGAADPEPGNREASGFDCDNDDPLGLISGSVADWQITASSTYPSSWGIGCSESNARLYRPKGMAWCAKFKSSSEWIQIDLGVEAHVTGIMTQGRGDGHEWVTSFMVSYSDDAVNWKFVTDQYGSQRIFEGNSDSFSVKHSYLDEPVVARYIKIHTYTWHNHPSLRLELIGCQPCKRILGIPPYARYAASSSRGARSQRNCIPEYGHYLSNKAWCPKRQNVQQWLQIDIGPPTKITGVILKGRGENPRPQYVTRFKVSFSNDTRLWYFYKDASPLDPRSAIWSFDRAVNQGKSKTNDSHRVRVFDGNNEHVAERIHYLASPFIARYVRIHPVSWRSRIAMRFGLIGCRPRGPCSTGFFRINNGSSCVGNLAYKKNAWIIPDSSNLQKRNLPDTNSALASPQPAASSQTSQSMTPTALLASEQLNSRHQTVPMMAYHRIGDQSGKKISSPPQFINGRWYSPNNFRDSFSSALTNIADPMASLAVDGWTGEEDALSSSDELLNVTRGPGPKQRSSSDRLMNDDPSLGAAGPSDRIAERFSQSSVGRRSACTVLHYRWPFVELPAWYVDLREQTEINGVVIYTARHGRASGDDIKDNNKFVSMSENLDRLSVYVEPESRSSRTQQVPGNSLSTLCGFVTRLNDAIYRPRLHIPCRQTLTGRYVHIEARGVRGRWSQEFSAFLCEVMIY